MTTDLLDGRWPISLTADSQFLEVAAFVSPLTASRLRYGGVGLGREERGWEGGGDRPHSVAAKVTTDLSGGGGGREGEGVLAKTEILRCQTKFGVWPLAPGHGLFVSRGPPYGWTDNLL